MFRKVYCELHLWSLCEDRRLAQEGAYFGFIPLSFFRGLAPEPFD